MAALLMYLKLPSVIYLSTFIWLANVQDITKTGEGAQGNAGTSALSTSMDSDPIEVAALGRPLFPGMLYDCRKDSFIPGVTLWDKKTLSENLDTHQKPQTDLRFSSSDSLSSKSSLMDISASLKASFLSGLVNVEGSAKYLHDTKSSNQQSRVTMYYSEISRFEQLTMTQLGKITYPQVFDLKTATHVVTAVLYGAQAFMVFDRTFSEDEDKKEIEGTLNIMVKKIPAFSIEGKGSVDMTEGEKKIAENIYCTFHGDFHLEQNPTTYMEALDLYEKLPTLLNENPQNAVPIKVWLYPLHLLDTNAAKLEREISTSLVSNIGDIIEELGEVERTCNDLSGNKLVNVISDIKERLLSFQESFGLYKLVLQKVVSRVLPSIRGGRLKDKSLEDILKIHYESPFNAKMLKEWLDDAKKELNLLSSYIKTLEWIEITDSVGLNSILLDPDIDVVVCLTFTSLKYEDPYLSALKEFLKSDKFKELEENNTLFSLLFENKSVTKWFNNTVIVKMRENLSHFRALSQANKDEKRIRFIISAISNTTNKGSSIYLYEQGNLINTQFQPVSKPPPPIVKGVLNQAVSLKLQKSPTGETVQFRVEYKQIKADSGADEQWPFINTPNEDFTLTGLELGKQYLIRYRIVGKVGVSEASDTVNPIPPPPLPVIVGGTGGREFSYKSSYRITTFSFTCTDAPSVSASLPASLMATFENFETFQVGKFFNYRPVKDITIGSGLIVKATLWPSKDNNRFGGLQFEIIQRSGAIRSETFKCGDLGEPVSIDVKSGKCHGMTGRSGYEIDALGFYFI